MPRETAAEIVEEEFVEQQNRFDFAHDAAGAYVTATVGWAEIKVDNRAYAVAALGCWAEVANRPVPVYDTAVVRMQPVPEVFASGYSDLLG